MTALRSDEVIERDVTSEKMTRHALSLTDSAHLEEWSALALAAGSIFGTPEWISTWWRHYGRGRPLLTAACRRADGALAGVLPVYLWLHRPMRVARLVGHGPGDVLGPVCQAADRPEVVPILVEHLEDENVAIFLGEQLPSEDDWPELEGMRFLRWEPSPVLTFESADWESFLASQSKSFRYDLSRKERRLVRDHTVSFRLASDPERFEQDFDLLLQLHRARWPDGSSFSHAEAFHRDFARLAFARGWSRLWFLEVDGRARAAWYGFRFAGSEVYYQAGRDPAWDRSSVGFLLLVHSIREAARDEMHEYHFLRGGEPFKYRLASSDPGLDTVAYARGSAAKATLATLVRMPKPLLRRVARA